MTVSDHTPGPWEAGSKPFIVPSTHEGENFSEGDWNIIPPLGEAGPVAIVNSQANAHLVAAAPDLLTAVEACLALMDFMGDARVQTYYAWKIASAAAAKARGSEKSAPDTQPTPRFWPDPDE